MNRILNLPPETPCILSFRGPDAIRFLNGQITQDATELGDRALPACVTDAKGRLQYFISVFAGPEAGAIWITCPKTQSEGLRDRLERYLIADDVEVDELTDRWAVVHRSQNASSASFSRLAAGSFGSGFDCWWQADQRPNIVPIAGDDAERLRILQRIPAWGAELKEGMLPPEAGLDQSSISYHKGCYIGQEVLSRIKSAGKLNRRLSAFDVRGTANPGDLLLLKGVKAGQLTSCALPEKSEGPTPALGYLNKKGYDGVEFVISDENSQSKGTATFTGWA